MALVDAVSDTQVSGAWAFAGLVITALIAPLLLWWVNSRSTKPRLKRIEEHTAHVGNGFAEDVLSKLDGLDKKLDDVVTAQAYEKGRFDQHLAEHRPPPT